MRQYFEVLGLRENASYEDVKSARIRLLKQYHPDLYAGNKKYAKMKSAEINEAFDKLKNYFENTFSQDFKQRELSQDCEKDRKIKLNKEKLKEYYRQKSKLFIDVVIGFLFLLLVILFCFLVF